MEQRGEFTHKDQTYTYVTKMEDTYYGPERIMYIRSANGSMIANYRECMSIAAIIELFKDSLDNL